MASLFNVSLSEIDVSVVEGGLSHNSYCCRVSGFPYYIKKYNYLSNISKVVNYINDLSSCRSLLTLIYTRVKISLVIHTTFDGF